MCHKNIIYELSVTNCNISELQHSNAAAIPQILHAQEKISKDDINSEEGIAAATLALEDIDNKIVIESNPGQSMEEIEAKMNEEKLKEQALLDAKNEQALADEALKLMSEPTKLNLANPLGKRSHKSCIR